MRVQVTSKPVLADARIEAVPASAWETLPACPVCGSAEHLRDLSVVEAGAPGGILSMCLACEHGFHRRRPSPAWFDEYYARGWDRTGQERLETGALQVRPDPKILDFCRSVPEGPVLEIGAGFGGALLAFREAGRPVYAVERSRHRADYLRNGLKIPCFDATPALADLPEPMKLVCSHHVLEHVSDPAAFVEAAVEVLAEDGFLYLAVPNWPAEHAPQTIHFVPHLSLFSLRSLTRLLARLGLRVVRSEVGREIQVLAVRGQGGGEQAAAAPEDVERRALAWMEKGFGTGGGDRTLVWWHSPTPDRLYDAATVRGRSGYAALRAALAAQRAVPRGRRFWARLLPRYALAGRQRFMRVRVDGDPGLPVRVRHDSAEPPVWIK